MRIFTLIGIILLLVVPFGIVRTTTESSLGDSTKIEYLGLLYWRMTFKVDTLNLDTKDSELIQTNWVEENGVYEGYFGDMLAVGLFVLMLLIVGLALAYTETKTNNSTYILMVSGLLLLILRFLHLSDIDSSFYETSEFAGVKLTSIEFPLGFILAMIFGILDFRQSSKK